LKLLFDQNISHRVAIRLRFIFPECGQVRELKLENSSDREIWDFAKRENFTIITFDADFYDLVTLFGHPPKVIWLRIGNTATDNLIEVIQGHAQTIEAFVSDLAYADIGCLEIH
jgi:predicted nuclease of predicted toxin-antitoxin system